MKTEYLVIQNGTLVDGSGSPPYRADVLVYNGIIKDIGQLGPVSDATIIDATGKYVTPGFVDIHRHCDNAVFKNGFGQIELAQGITTAVSGNCGLSPFPATSPHDEGLHAFLQPLLGAPAPHVSYDSYPAYREAFNTHAKKCGIPVDIRHLIGSCSVRIAVKGFSQTPFNAEERKRACAYVAEAMDHGALGLSMGLMYMPEYFTPRDDLMLLARTAARRGGVLTVHIRNEGDGLPESVEEAAQIAAAADAPLEISHFKTCGTTARREKLLAAIDIIERYRRRGVDINADFYPYTYGASTMLSLIPPSYMKDTQEDTFVYMTTREGACALKQALTKTHVGWDNYILSLGFERVIISSVRNQHNQPFIGKTLQDLVNSTPNHDPYTVLSDFIADEKGQTGIFVMSMSPEDVDMIASLPWTMAASDALYPDTGRAHPRAYGAFPRILCDMVRDRAVLPLSAAIHKMTAMPARKMGLAGKGFLQKSASADICIFDLQDVSENSGSTTPVCGMTYVIRGGNIVYTYQPERIE